MPQVLCRRRMKLRRQILNIVVLLGLLGTQILGVRPSSAQQPAPVVNVEYQIKAGYFVYFGTLIAWPEEPFDGANKEFTIGVLGKNPFARHIRATQNGHRIAAGRITADKIQNKKITVRHFKSVAEFERDYKPCHILFVSRLAEDGVRGETAEHRLLAALKSTEEHPVLLVTEAQRQADSRGLAEKGAVISYWSDPQNNKVKMFINRDAEKREGLKISSRLIGLRGVVTPMGG